MTVTVENQYLNKPVEVTCCQSESPHGLAWEKNLGLGSEKPTTNCLSHGKAKRSNKKVGCRGILNFQNVRTQYSVHFYSCLNMHNQNEHTTLFMPL
jgi:hypothetical protein